MKIIMTVYSRLSIQANDTLRGDVPVPNREHGDAYEVVGPQVLLGNAQLLYMRLIDPVGSQSQVD